VGSFKEYYEDVGNFQDNLEREDERELVNRLANVRFDLREALFAVEGMPELIVKTVKSLTSVASVTDDFNSNKQGNNSIVEKRVKDLLAEPETKSVGDLHLCNFRMEWLFSLLEQLEVDSISKAHIEYFKHAMEEMEKRLVSSCLKMAVRLAMENRGRMHHEDAVQCANLALVEASKKFDPKAGVRFNTYAHHKVLFRMKQKLMEDPFGIVHVPRSAEVEEGTGSWFSLEEDVDVGRQRSLADMLPDEGPSLDEDVDRNLIRDSLKQSLGRFLTEQEAEIIFIRYLSSGKMLTYQEVSDTMKNSLTRERIRQIEDRALKKLSERVELKELLAFYEGV
jgi:RNA polymerase sigma factor (sigma-70 family)